MPAGIRIARAGPTTSGSAVPLQPARTGPNDGLGGRHLRIRPATTFLFIGLGVLAAQCGGGGRETITGPTDEVSASIAAAGPAALLDSDIPPLDIAPPEVFVGAGDIAQCTTGGQHEETARLLDSIPGTVFALGDNAYQSGTLQEYNECYGRFWGRHRSRTRPVPGNHEYETPGAAGYFDYFGGNAGPRGLGYYSFDLGSWHVVALNSNIPVGTTSAQGSWLRADLAANPSRCTLAYWHHPMYSSGRHGNYERMGDLWRILSDAGAELVLSGHDHTYERFAPQDAGGFADDAHGIRQFVVGTGGASLYPFSMIRPNSEARLSALGVLKLTLRTGGYDWEFVTVSGPGDFGSGACH